MNIQIKIPEDLSRYCGGLYAFEIDAETFDGILIGLIELYPELRPRLLGRDGQLLSHLIVFSKGEALPTANLSQLTVSPGDELEIMFLASGG